MSLSREELRKALDENRVGKIDRFRIEFAPRLGFRLVSEERVAQLVHGAVAAFNDWKVESLAFLPVEGSPDGVVVTLRRPPKATGAFQIVSVLAITPLVAAVAVITVVALFYSVKGVVRLGSEFVEKAPAEALASAATGFQIAAFAALLGIGFLFYRQVIE